MDKVLMIDYEKCTGCRLCELVCAVKHDGKSNPVRSRIKVMKWEAEGHYIPMSCQQCEDAPCMQGCPVGAIHRDDALNRVAVNYDVCIGCRACMQACPYDAIYLNEDKGVAEKCHYCAHRTEVGIEPACVVVCPEQAIIAGDLHDPMTQIAPLGLSTRRAALSQADVNAS